VNKTFFNLLLALLISCLTAGLATARVPAPVLILDAAIQANPGQPLTLSLGFDSGGHAISALVFSLDIDRSRLTFDPTDANQDGVPDSVTLPEGVPSITVINWDPADSDGEIDVLLSNLSGAALPQGVILEFELTPDQGGWAADWVAFSDDPPASFGNDLGQDVAGTTEVLGLGAIFVDGFESGDTGAWSQVMP